MILTVIIVVAALGLVGYNQHLQARSQQKFVEQVSGAVSTAVSKAVDGAVQSIVAPPIIHPQLDERLQSQVMGVFEQKDDPWELDTYDPTDATISNDRGVITNGADPGIEGFSFKVPR
jgi:hypothetical protein